MITTAPVSLSACCCSIRTIPINGSKHAVAEALQRQTYNLDSVKHILFGRIVPTSHFYRWRGLDTRSDRPDRRRQDVGRYDLLLAGGAR